MELGFEKRGLPERNLKPLPIRFIATIAIYSMILPVIYADIVIFLYQFFYFGGYSIPMIKRSDYVVIDRHKLTKLNVFQKLNCIYCQYTNGITALAQAVANQTELYNCAIKHSPNSKVTGNEHEEKLGFHEYGELV